jgi:glycosyltransferase involved in cell wall biosynthesis
MPRTPSICFVGLGNLPVLAKEYSQFGIGGAQVQQTLLARALARRGYHISMVVGDYGQPDGASWDGVKTFKAFSVDEGLPVLRFLYPRWFKLHEAVSRANADIYYYSIAGTQLGQVALFTRLHGRKLIFRIASDADCDPDRLLLQFWREKKLYEYGLRRADAILAQGVNQQQAMARNYGRDSTIARTLVEGSNRGFSLAERDIPVLWVSNVRQVKRPDRLMDLAHALPELQVHMVGGPVLEEPRIFDEMRERAATLGNLKFHGQVPYHAISDFFERARLFVNTSDVEGFPNTYLQAWARGTPVIGFFDPDGTIAREGLGRAVANLEDMHTAVRELASNAEAWRAASERCKAFMAKEYGEDKILAPYLATIDRLSQQMCRS